MEPPPDPPPEAVCMKQKPTLRTWPARYVRIQGKSLLVFQSPNDKKARGSSIPDVSSRRHPRSPIVSH